MYTYSFGILTSLHGRGHKNINWHQNMSYLDKTLFVFPDTLKEILFLSRLRPMHCTLCYIHICNLAIELPTHQLQELL